MNILFIIHTDGLGGANRSLLQLIKGIKETDDSVFIYCIVPLEREGISDALEKLGCLVIPECFSNCTTVLYGVRETIKYYNRLPNYRKAFNDVKNLDIDIVHTNTSVCDLGAYLAKRLGVPHIWHVRERMDYYKMSLIRPFHYRRQIESPNTKVICISNYIDSYIRSRFSEIRSTVIYNPVDKSSSNIDLQDINPGGFESGVTGIIIAGIIVRNKGIEDAINAMDIVVHDYSIQNVMLYVVGTSENTLEYEKSLRQLVSEYKLDDNVSFLPFSKEIDRIRKKCDIALQCSIMEGFGRVTVESMLDNLYVIGARSGATAELIREGYNGWLYEPGNSKELAEKIKNVMCLDSRIGDMVKCNAYKWAKDTFNTEAIGRRIIDIYKDVLKKSETV